MRIHRSCFMLFLLFFLFFLSSKMTYTPFNCLFFCRQIARIMQIHRSCFMLFLLFFLSFLSSKMTYTPFNCLFFCRQIARIMQIHRSCFMLFLLFFLSFLSSKIKCVVFQHTPPTPIILFYCPPSPIEEEQGKKKNPLSGCKSTDCRTTIFSFFSKKNTDFVRSEIFRTFAARI